MNISGLFYFEKKQKKGVEKMAKIFVCADVPQLYKRKIEKMGHQLTLSIKSCDEFWLMEDTITNQMSQQIMKAYKLNKPTKNKAVNMAA